MNLTDQELLMLEQLCYINSDVASAAGVSDFSKIDINVFQNKTINEILQVFDETAISNLEALGDTEIDGACASGKEWAQIITYLKSSDNLNNLQLTKTMVNNKDTPLALCFIDEIRN